ncbi:hypothetical protein [Nocardia nova]|uniref:hypothetical protein n=1 Tax=Nocardia nova TaxID=37330 RepID=UPI000AC3B97A|nr:hypothetical protein [Nocardia nova]
MTLNETSPPSSVVGPMRYDLWLKVPEDENADDPGFTVNALALPREGEGIVFESELGTISVKVEKIAHWFYPATNEAPRRAIFVDAVADKFCYSTVRKLRDAAQLERWIADFPMLEPLSP